MKKKLFRVRFIDQSEQKTVEVVVETVTASEFIGLVTLEGFVFNDNKKLVIMPEEEAARARYSKTERLHVPYHSLVFVEEFDEEPADLKHLPFVKEVSAAEKAAARASSSGSSSSSSGIITAPPKLK